MTKVLFREIALTLTSILTIIFHDVASFHVRSLEFKKFRNFNLVELKKYEKTIV